MSSDFTHYPIVLQVCNVTFGVNSGEPHLQSRILNVWSGMYREKRRRAD